MGYGLLILMISAVVIFAGLLIVDFIGAKYFNLYEEVEEEEDDDDYIYYRVI